MSTSCVCQGTIEFVEAGTASENRVDFHLRRQGTGQQIFCYSGKYVPDFDLAVGQEVLVTGWWTKTTDGNPYQLVVEAITRKEDSSA